MIPLTFTCRKSDIRNIKITCRCGTVSVAEIPQQVARALNLHPCPGCNAGYLVTQKENGKWRIERVVESISEITTVPMTEHEAHIKNYFPGMRIKISTHPKHLGKLGTIVGEEDCGGGYSTPVIKLDDGTQLTGAECWWTPVAN